MASKIIDRDKIKTLYEAGLSAEKVGFEWN